jgi:hypothetical protein
MNGDDSDCQMMVLSPFRPAGFKAWSCSLRARSNTASAPGARRPEDLSIFPILSLHICLENPLPGGAPRLCYRQCIRSLLFSSSKLLSADRLDPKANGFEHVAGQIWLAKDDLYREQPLSLTMNLLNQAPDYCWFSFYAFGSNPQQLLDFSLSVSACRLARGQLQPRRPRNAPVAAPPLRASTE